MSQRFLGVAMSLVFIAFAVAMAVAGFSRSHPTWWEAAISLAVLGGVSPMILSVSSKIMPVFLRRDWVSPKLIQAMIVLSIASGWLVFVGRLQSISALIALGSASALAAAILLPYNIAEVFRKRQPVRPAAPLPFPEQAQADAIGNNFTRLCSLWFIVGTVIGLINAFYIPKRGQWELVWAHAMLVGFALSMASGVSYHVLPRWTTGRWKSIVPLRIHWYITVVVLPLMIVALAIQSSLLFKIAAPIQALAIAIWIVNCVPFLRLLPRRTQLGFGAALAMLAIGIIFGASFALGFMNGPLMRPVHAELNLFGWAGLMISGIAYYLVPRFAGAQLRWSKFAVAQLTITIVSLAIGFVLLWLRIEGHDTTTWIELAHLGSAVGFGMLGVIVAGTFWSKQTMRAGALNVMPKPKTR